MSTTLLDLGARIRRERQKRQLTLEAFSKKTGLSKSFLSQVERGLTEPSITSLKKISKQFGYSVVNLFQNGNHINSNWEYNKGTRQPPERASNYVERSEVVRADKRKRFALPNSKVIYDLLTPDMNRRLEVMYMQVSEGENSGEEPMIDPPGEKMCIVLKGTLEATVGNEVHRLNEGDSLYYPANTHHSWRALEGDSIEVIWILTPPSF
ncbi:MAG: helix-turn-helix transcriptional regulator [Deltaproteobacteria bacterium]|nr:helix-turn-helix transcriptional regulator [Deltaproteobacteria bacterium]